MCIVIVCKPGCDVIDFEINLIFLNQLFFLHAQNVKSKMYFFFGTKEAFKMKQKTFFIIFKEQSLKQIKQFFFWKVRTQREDIYIFVLKKSGLIRKIRLVSKFITSQPG